MASRFFDAITRKKNVDDVRREMEAADALLKDETGTEKKGELKKVLKLHDLLAYGVGSTVGGGIYSTVVAGILVTGPSITIAFVICAAACICTGLAYAEFAVRIPQAGSAYTFSYTAWGELIAWTVGWALTLEYSISAAATARSFGSYISAIVSLFSGQAAPPWVDGIPLGGGTFVFQPTGSVLIVLLTLLMLTGVKNSSLFNVVCTLINLAILFFFIIAGATLVQAHLWTLSAEGYTNYTAFDNASICVGQICDGFSNSSLCSIGLCFSNISDCYAATEGLAYYPVSMPIPVPGGYNPFGVNGLMAAAGIMFFSYLGFDAVSTLAEEAQNPKRDLPLGIIGSLLIALLIYVAGSLVLTGMIPWNTLITQCAFDWKGQVQTTIPTKNFAPLEYAFLVHGWKWAGAIMAFGALLTTTVSTFTGLLGQPRIFYRAARDGLFFPLFGDINPKTGIPTIGTLVVGLFAASIAAIIPIDLLSDFISLGSLYAFSSVVCGLLLFRYGDLNGSARSRRAVVVVLAFVLECFGACITLTWWLAEEQAAFLIDPLRAGDYTNPLFIVACVFFGLMAGTIVLLAVLPQNDTRNLIFACPFVPFVPCFGIFVNIYMMSSRQGLTYYIFLGWFGLGVLIYFLYGYHHSKLRNRVSEEKQLLLNNDFNR